jgi:hypothetical protein
MEGNTFTDTGSTIRALGDHSVIRNNSISNALHGSGDYCGNHSDGIGPVWGHDYTWIIGNTIQDTLMYIFFEYNGESTYNYIVNNLLIRTDTSGETNGQAITIINAPNTTVDGNLIIDVGSTGVFSVGIKFYNRASDGSGYESPNGTARNNILIAVGENKTTGITIGTGDAESSPGFAANNNYYYFPNLTEGTKTFSIAGVTKTWAEWRVAGYDVASPETGCCGTDPGLTDIVAAGGFDFTASSASSAVVNTGATASYPYDKNNITRPQGATWDIGAYEYTAGGGSTYTVTPSATNCTISPAVDQLTDGTAVAFTLTGAYGYSASGGGTCGGALVSSTWTTEAVTGDCTAVCTGVGHLGTITPGGAANVTITPGGTPNATMGN